MDSDFEVQDYSINFGDCDYSKDKAIFIHKDYDDGGSCLCLDIKEIYNLLSYDPRLREIIFEADRDRTRFGKLLGKDIE